MEKPVNKLLILVFLVSLFLPRFIHIERPITVDELTWLTFSSDFIYGISNREFEHTYQDHHPGVTTMIAGTAAYAIEDRAYRAAGGYMDNDTFLLIERMEDKGYSIFDVLVTARRLMALASCLVLAASFWILWRAWGPFPAWVVMMFVILDPMVIGQTRLFSHEGLMSSLVFLTWASFYHYTYHGRQRSSLIISGLALGFALLTKITALGITPVIGLMLLFEMYRERKQREGKKVNFLQIFFSAAKPVAIWFLLAVIVFIAVWPAAWNNPIETIVHMFKHTFKFANSANSALSANTWVSSAVEGVGAYLHTIWAHPTLITWVGNLVVIISLLFPGKLKENAISTKPFAWLYLYFGILVAAIGSASSFRADRYMTSVHFFLAMFGGFGLLILIERLRDIEAIGNRKWIPWTAAVVLLVLQVGIIFPARPYYYTYLNPFEGDVWWGVHGAFLDQAAEYLAEKPDAEELGAMTFSPGSFMFFFPGKTYALGTYHTWNPTNAQNLSDSDYLIVNFEISHLTNPPRIIGEIGDVVPEHTITFQGREYVWIYRVDDLPDSVFVPDPEE
jgi:4-amino-4-deoxy-L-arabinose transferase-like glycosyltransferase